MGQKMSRKRRYRLLIFVGITFMLSAVFLSFQGFLLDGIISILAIDAVFLAVIMYLLENNRIQGKIGRSISNQYRQIVVCYAWLSAVTLIAYFLPSYTYPAAAAALFMSMVSNPEIAMAVCGFLAVILGVAANASFFELAAEMLLILTGAQTAKTMQKKEYRKWGAMLLFSVSVLIPTLFHYLDTAKPSGSLLLWNIALGGISVGLYLYTADKIYEKAEYMETDMLKEIIREDYSLVQEIKNYSLAEYVHALKVSTIASKCAAEIGGNELAAAAGGFYYRVGILEGEPFIENGVRLAEEKCFPESVISILYEYNGEEQLPSSRESAIVHMADACLKKVEMLSQNNLSSSWNQDMVIYQTLNELSSTGIYDESGLSMNQFLKVRELLVREGIGYDNTH